MTTRTHLFERTCAAFAAMAFATLSAIASNPASETFDIVSDGDGYTPPGTQPFTVPPPFGVAPAFWVGQGEYRSNPVNGLVEEVPSGTHGIVSANASIGHAEVYPSYVVGFDTFHRNGGSADGVPFTGPFSFKMDIYLDPAWLPRCLSGGCGAEDDFWINQGYNDNLPGPPNGNYLTEGSLRFNVTDIAPTDGTKEYSFHTGPGGPIGSLFQTTTPGWYTVEQIVNVGPDGPDLNGDPDVLITHRIWNVARTQVLSNPNTFPSFNDANGAMLGGDRYSSFFFVHTNITPFIAIDNVQVGPPIPVTHVVDDDGMASMADCGAADAAFTTIGAAIAAASPGDIIKVCPGNYPPFTLNKRVEIRGAQVGVDARGRVVGAPNPAIESIVTGAGTQITLVTGCAGSTIDGLSVNGGTRGIESTSGPLNNLVVRNNHMADQTGSAMFLNDSGSDITVHQNVMIGSAASSTTLHLDTDTFNGFHLTSNHILRTGGAASTGWFVDGNRNVSASANRNPLISQNLFRGHAAGANIGRFALRFATISNNDFDANSADGLQGGPRDSSITGNRFTNNGRSGLALTGFGGAGDPNRGAINNTITANQVLNNGFTMNAEGIFCTTGQFPGTISTNVFHGNFIIGNLVGARYTGGETIDFEDNWWGDPSGPTDPVGANPAVACPSGTLLGNLINATGAGQLADGNGIDYCPWNNSIASLTLNSVGSPCANNNPLGQVRVRIDLANVEKGTVGGQFFLQYDQTVLDFVSAVPGTGDFTLEIFEIVNEGAGTIDYAVGVPFGGGSTLTSQTMATFTFNVLQNVCSQANLVTFRPHTPPTQLTNPYGQALIPNLTNLGAIRIDNTPPPISCPPNISVNPPAGTCPPTAVVVGTATATDNCTATPSIIIAGTRSDSQPLANPYPLGVTTITWTATDECGNSSQCLQSVTVSGSNVISATVELAGVWAPVGTLNISRCITFVVHDCGGGSITIPQVVSFSSPAPGTPASGSAMVLVPCGTSYDCITARDRLHTLRRSADAGDANFGIVGPVYVANFASSNGLIGGNLNDDAFVDILDFGAFVGQFGNNYGTGNTTCSTSFPHADISGDGSVFVEDYTFIANNFLVQREANCCGMPADAPGGEGEDDAGPITRISVRELRARGLRELIAADLNKDGWLDMDDIAVFLGSQ